MYIIIYVYTRSGKYKNESSMYDWIVLEENPTPRPTSPIGGTDSPTPRPLSPVGGRGADPPVPRTVSLIGGTDPTKGKIEIYTL